MAIAVKEKKKSNSRKQQTDSTQSGRKRCIIGNVLMGVAEPKVLIVAIGARAYASEEAFFRKFVYKVTEGEKNKHRAAKRIPGLAEKNGNHGVCWKLSCRQLLKGNLPVRGGLDILLDLIDQSSQLHQCLIGADERNRLLSDSLH